MRIARDDGPHAGRFLEPTDEANLVLDHAGQVNVFLVAGLLAPEGFIGETGPDLGALRAAIATRIAGLPALRVVPRPAGRRHRWTAMAPNLEYHVRLVGPAADLAAFQELCGSLMSVPLERDRPLWELLVVPGLPTGTVGINAYWFLWRLCVPSGPDCSGAPR